jgi:4-carboxymuconolactone decarboxylase
MTPDELRKAGMSTRRATLGDSYVDRAQANKTPFDENFQRYITENAWGEVWSHPGLPKRERSLITLAILAALGHHEEFALHLRATRNTGATVEDVKQMLMHVAVYGGVPAANNAFRIAKQVYAELDGDRK